MWQPLHGFARQRGVGGNHAVHLVAQQGGSDHGDLLGVQIGGNFQEQGHVLGHALALGVGAGVLLGQFLAALG